MEIKPEELAVRDRYKLMIGSILPRPIAFVSTISPEGAFNLAPYSFFNGVGSNPMTVVFCPANDSEGREKDTLRNCKPVAEGGTGQFVVNVAGEPFIREVAAAAEALPYGESEFELTGLTPTPSTVVKPPRVSESPLAFECQTLQVIRTNSDAPAAGNLVLGEVVHIYAVGGLISERGYVDADKLAAVGRMGGLSYCRTRDRFELPRGRKALESG
jgi:flavin reductase (DIM6/NTAB) family NADH-FMN oxidoreductase RutF